MASVQPVQAVAERPDIHKSCKALEVVVNLLDDYSEAARAIVTLNKKLSKALRDVATVKPTGDIPGNAFNSSANIFDVLSDVDAKFSKFVDKECDVISAEVKKWFKKLAKEEKVHDDKIANANVKIKQAGQSYEKKAKKNAVDAPEEHNRYVNLLNTLGPEISQIKYNHTLSVSQRNAAVTFQVAATLSRVAEAEWLRSGECIRRFSPLIGQLGEWKAFCEGGWTGPIPGDFPSVDPPHPPREMQDAVPNDAELGVSPASPRPIQGSGTLRAMSLKPPPTVYDDGSVRSIASLGSFPEPPNHFPIPPLTGSFSSNSATSSPTILHNIPHSDGAMQIRTSSDVSGSSSDPPSILPRVTESPLEEIAPTPVLTDRALPPDSSQDHLAIPLHIPAQNVKSANSTVTEGPGAITENNDNAQSLPAPNTTQLRDSPPASVPPTPTLLPGTQSRQQHDPAPSIDSRSNSVTGFSNSFRRGDYLDDREFGVDDSIETTPLKAKTLDSSQSRVDRSDTSRSNGNMVAAIRDRYTRATGPSSPPPRDIPRLPLSVATIATKYQSENNNEPTVSAGRQTRSPTNDLPQRSRDPGPSSPHPQQPQQFPLVTPGRTETLTDDLERRRQRIEELEELERRENALELRAREREFTARQRERAVTLRSGALDGYASDASRSSKSPFAHRHRSQASLQSQPHTPTLSSNYSYSTTSLLPPGPSGPAMQRVTKDGHRPDCQCPACTVARYSEKPLTAQPRPQGREKSKGGWMRRLSMPVVGNAFSSESKKLATIAGKGVNTTALGSLGDAHLSAVSLGRR
ncbi:hypothetical protein EI94DRAFT_1713173 [Lactarius quietus]|nr:hypothetical protein EI94DRAFT_1713173 [Lactarius quietus]